MVDAHEHTHLAGPAATEAERRLAEFDEHARLDNQARFAGTVLTDPRRLTRLMRRQDPAVYPGTFATCVFQPDKALCQQQRDLGGATRPGLGDCRPLECGNVALTTDNLTALRVELDPTNSPCGRACRPCSFIGYAADTSRSPNSSPATPRRPGDPPHRPTQPR
jgi:hypothetical protein